MVWNAEFNAKYRGFEEFKKGYEEAVAAGAPISKEVILGAVGNFNAGDRIQITNFLLDEGADAAVVSPGDDINALHVLFSHHAGEYDIKLEAPVLKGLLEGGADINLRSPRFGAPLQMLWRIPISDEEFAPFYDVIFSGDYIDMDAVLKPSTGHNVRGMFAALPPARAELARRGREYDKSHSSSGR